MDRYLFVITLEGNTTKQIGKPKEILINMMINDMLFSEYLVTDYWHFGNEIALNSLWFLNKIYINLIETGISHYSDVS